MRTAKPLKRAMTGFGLRQRLLLSFIAISGFAVLAAVVGNYAFYAIGGALHQVTEISVPPAIATLEFAQRTERIVAAGPVLLAATDNAELASASTAVEQEVKEAAQLLNDLSDQDLRFDKLIEIQAVFNQVAVNLAALKSAAQRRISAADRKATLVRDTFDAYNQFRAIWTPRFQELQGNILALQRVLDAADSSPEERLGGINRLNTAIRDLAPLEQIQQEAAIAFEALVRAAGAGTPAALDTIRGQVDPSVWRIDNLVSGLDPDVSLALIIPLSRLRTSAIGNSSIMAARQVELETVAEGRRLTVDNATLSNQLSDAVAALVAGSKRGIATATEQVGSVQRFGSMGLLAVVALSLISSALIVWLYVGRNIVARLTALSDRMLTLAQGDLKSSLPQGGTDEIGRMAEALGVFRATAIEMEEANLKEIREARARLTEAIETISEGFSLYDAEDKLIVCNSHYRKLFAPHAEVMVPGTSFEKILRMATGRGLIEDAEGREEAWIAERLARHHASSEMHIQRRSDGRWIQVSERKTANGGVVAIYADITKLKQHEVELAAARDAADEANRTKSSFLATMSHEIRTPMNAIIGMSDLLTTSRLEPQQREMAETIRMSGQHLLTIINQILDFSKIESGKLELEQAPFNLADCIEEALQLVAPKVAGTEIELTYALDDAMPRLVVGDAARLRQVLVNLLANAIKFTPAGEVGVTVSARRLEGARREVHFAVHDTGIGIPKDRFDRLFKVFSQVDASTTRRYGGTGLGLAISKRLSELMGGRIWAESEPGKGSKFHFTIVADEVEALERAAADGEQPELAGKRVLIVDDNASNRLLLKLQTERWGMRARDTNSPAVALEWIVQGDPFDVALLDYQMPEMDGSALARKIRAVRGAHAPVLILLSSTDQSLASAHADAGFAAGLSKPLRLSASARSAARDDWRPTRHVGRRGSSGGTRCGLAGTAAHPSRRG